MRPRQLLAEKLGAESEPYGFSLVTWGVGALLIDQFGVPGIAGVLAYLVGAVAGFAVLAAVVSDHLLGTIDVDSVRYWSPPRSTFCRQSERC